MASTAPPTADDDVSLSQLLSRALASSHSILASPSPSSAAVQAQLNTTLSDLKLSRSLIQHLALFSPNEHLSDISTSSLRYLLLPSIHAQLLQILSSKGGKERLENIKLAKSAFNEFVQSCERYGVVEEEERDEFRGPKEGVTDPSRRREDKIRQYKREKEIKSKLEELRKRRIAQRPRIASSSSSTTTTAAAPEDLPDSDDLLYNEEDEDDEVTRPLYLSLLQLHYLRAFAELGSIEMEEELLAGMLGSMSDLPRGPGKGEDGREREKEQEELWRLDKIKRDDGPLLDSKGKARLTSAYA